MNTSPILRAPAKSTIGRKYSYRPAPADHPLPTVPHPAQLCDSAAPLPASVDWRPLLRPVRDQGQRGVCFSFAFAALKEFDCAVWAGLSGPVGFDLSPEYIAWRTEVAEGTFPNETGASIADTMAVGSSWGICPESFLPYSDGPGFAGNAACDVAAQPYRIGTACTVVFSDPDNIRKVLAARKCIEIGFACYPSFEATGSDGVVKPVDPSEGAVGGHAVLLCGYSDAGWLIRNSWGASWGAQGYCTMPYGYEEHWFEAMVPA